MEEKFLWQFYWDCRREGSVEGLFVATESDIKKAIGKDIYFGEILGKHSEVYGRIKEGDITKVNLSPDVVSQVTHILGNTWSGYNPLQYVKGYYNEDDSEEDYEDEDDC